MITLGQRVQVLLASQITKRTHIKIVSKAEVIYQYYRTSEPDDDDDNEEYTDEFASEYYQGAHSEADYSSPTLFSPLSGFAKMPFSYFKMNPDPNIPHNYEESKRVAAFAIELFNPTLFLMVFPYSVAMRMQKKAGNKKVRDFDWEIRKTGVGIDTRYRLSILENRVKIPEPQMKIVEDTVSQTPMRAILEEKKRIYTKVRFTPFDRFEIMDI